MTASKSFPVFDADTHVVEPPDLWDRYVDRDYRALAKQALWREEGETNSYLKVNGKVFRDAGNPNIPRHAIWQPGMTWQSIGELDPDERHPLTPGVLGPGARLLHMDLMGVDQAFLYPTWFAEGFPLVEDPDVAHVLARAYNDWVADFCSFSPHRLFAAAILPFQNMDFTLQELRRVAANPSFRGIFIRPAFAPLSYEDRYFTHPYFDPLWEALEELGMPAAVHPTPGLWNPEWTSHGPFVEKMSSRSQRPALLGGAGAGPSAGGGNAERSVSFSSGTAGASIGHPVAPILSYWLDNHMFVASTLIGYTVMQRYPRLKVVVSHGKASWMEEVLEKMEASTKTVPLTNYYPVRTDPEEMWEEGHVLLGFDAEERLIRELPHAYERKVVWGSRYPHHDTTTAWDAISSLTSAGVEQPMIARMMGANAREQFGIDAP